MITNEIIEDYLRCRYKAFLKFNDQFGTKNDYELLECELLEIYRRKFFQNLLTQINGSSIQENIDSVKEIQTKKSSFQIRPIFKIKEFEIHFEVLEITPAKFSPRKRVYIPISLLVNEKISKIDKLSLTIRSLIFKQIKGITSEFGKIIYGCNFKTVRIKLKSNRKEAQKIINELTKTVNVRYVNFRKIVKRN